MAEPIGQTLRKAREERSLSVEKIAQALHIRQRYLEALENDRRQDLPSPVQAKGFLRMYAEYLNLPVRPLLDSWEGKPEPPAPASLPAADSPTIEPGPALAPPQVVAPHQGEAPQGEPHQGVAPLAGAAVLPAEPALVLAVEVNPPAAPTVSPTASFEQIGSQLRKQREALGLSLPEVERYIHVRLHYLEALEEGRIDRLPSPVQGRGMLSNYARFLNLDGDALLLQFATGLQTRRIAWMEQTDPGQAARRSAKRPAQNKTGTRRLFSPDLLIGSVLVLIIVGFAVWVAAQVNSLQNSADKATPPSIAEVLLNNPSPSPAQTGTGTPVALLSTLLPGEVAKSPAGAASAGTQQVTVPVTGTARLQLYILARQRAYLRVTVDGKVAFDGRVEPGIGYPFAGDTKIEFLTGSASGLQVYFNQKDLGVLGLAGQVKSMVFTKDGSLTPTPRFTATPTRTIEPTATLKPSPTAPTVTITPYIP